MHIFHYLADQLKDTPNFASANIEESQSSEGAIYNDYDFDTRKLMQDADSVSYIREASATSCERRQDDLQSLVPQSAVDHAVLEADRFEGILYQQLTYDTEIFDCESDISDQSYMEKVYLLGTWDPKAWSNLTISEDTINAFEMRLRGNWNGSDSVYVAWLLAQGKRRSSFNYDEFFRLYPDFEEKRQKLMELCEGKSDEEKETESPFGNMEESDDKTPLRNLFISQGV